MKKIILLIVMIIFVLCFILAGCQDTMEDDNIEIPDAIEEQDQEETENTTEEQEESKQEEDEQENVDNEKIIYYLSILGLDESCNYAYLDSFPVNDTEKSYLLDIYDITEDDFADIISTLETGGFSLVSDIMTNDDAKTRSYQYSDNENVYTEFVFSYEAKYINIIFTPIV